MVTQSLKYQGVILEIGSMVPEFLPHGILIFFGESAPPELRDTSLVHNGMRKREREFSGIRTHCTSFRWSNDGKSSRRNFCRA